MITGTTRAGKMPIDDILSEDKRILIDGIRSLIEGGDVSLNRHGAAGLVDKDCIWLHSKRFIDDLKSTVGLHGDNEQIRTKLFYLELLVKSNSGVFTHKKEIVCDGTSNSFNLLCLPLRNIWSNPDDYPPQMKGITVLDIS